MQTAAAMFVSIGLIAASAGILSPILALWVSLASGPAQGRALGRQTASSSLGQSIGLALGGFLFSLTVFPDAAFLVAAAAALVGGILALRLPMRVARLTPPPERRRSDTRGKSAG